MVASSSGAISGSGVSASAPCEQRRERFLERLLDRQTSSDWHVAADAVDPLGARRVGDDQLRLGQVERMLQLVGCHQPLSRVATPPALSDAM